MLKKIISASMAAAVCLTGNAFCGTVNAAPEGGMTLADYTQSYEQLSKVSRVSFEGDKALVSFEVMVQKDGCVVSPQKVEWEVYGSVKPDFDSGTVMNAGADYSALAAKSYCLVTSDSQGYIVIKAGSNDNCAPFPFYVRLKVGGDGNFDSKYISFDPIEGDVNADGEYSIADAVLLEKWLLGVPDTKLPDWERADFCRDKKLDMYDLCLMKKALAKKTALHSRQMTHKGVFELASKNRELRVSDFDPFIGEDIGSGLFVMKYDIADREGWYVLVGSDGTSEEPVYVIIQNSDGEENYDLNSENFNLPEI